MDDSQPPMQPSAQSSALKRDLGGGGMIAVGGILNLLFAAVYYLTYTPSTFSRFSPASVTPVFIIAVLIFIATGIMAYRGTKTKIMGIIAILIGLSQITWLYTSGVLFVSGLLAYGFIFGIIGGIKVFSQKAM